MNHKLYIVNESLDTLIIRKIVRTSINNDIFVTIPKTELTNEERSKLVEDFHVIGTERNSDGITLQFQTPSHLIHKDNRLHFIKYGLPLTKKMLPALALHPRIDVLELLDLQERLEP